MINMESSSAKLLKFEKNEKIEKNEKVEDQKEKKTLFYNNDTTFCIPEDGKEFSKLHMNYLHGHLSPNVCWNCLNLDKNTKNILSHELQNFNENNSLFTKNTRIPEL